MATRERPAPQAEPIHVAVPRSNLPIQVTSFIGRHRELSEARRLLENSRLLTLTGPGGSGKTRLCLQLAAETAADFPDGVYFVPLAPIRDPGLVLSSIAQNIGLQDSRERALIEHLTSYLANRRTLLVLDNFEQLLAAAPVLSELLRETRQLKLVITSRACLRISGEQEYSVPPLDLPDPQAPDRARDLGECESVRLFVERARAMVPDFTVDDRNAPLLVQITWRLDGLPLAIELAAARVKLLPPEAMLPRLDRSLGLLVSRARDLPDRQQTLRSTIAWSYGLLSPGTQRLLAICSVFRGGASLERIESLAEAVASSDLDLLAGLEELVDHSLLRRLQTRIGPRFAMLETIREYAAERLAEMPEERRIRERHAAEFLAMAETAQDELTGPGELEWLVQLDLEHNNLRAAIDWYTRESPSQGLRLAAALRPFWSARGHFTEGRQRLRILLERSTERTVTRVHALNSAAWLAVDQGDYADAAARLDESITLSRELNDRRGEGIALAHLGRCKIASGHPAEAIPYLDQALPILRESGNAADIAIGMLYSGLCAIFTDQPALARDRLTGGVETCRQLGFDSLGARARLLLSYALIDLGELRATRAALTEALPTSMRLGDHWIIPQQMGGFAALAAKTGRPRQALRFAGFARAYSRDHDFSMPNIARDRLETWTAPARQLLGLSAETALLEGSQLTLEQAAAAALADEPEDMRQPAPTPTLTARELEVAGLVARGLTNREVADRLYLSVRTVEVHVDHILAKLGLHTRTELARWVFETNVAPKDT